MTELTAIRSPWPVRIGLGIVVAIYLTYSSFGSAHPVLWGHFGHHAAEYSLRARNSIRFHMVTPATSAGFETPTPNFYYFHHPIGYHHLLTVGMLLLGDHLWIATVVPALTGLLVIWALFALARRWWSRELGLVAVAVWVGLPFVCTFSILTDAMFPSMACSILMVHAYLNYLERPSRRWLLAACAATMMGGLLMWEAYFQAFFHGIHSVGWWLSRRGRAARYGKLPAPLVWLFATGLTAMATLGFHVLFVVAKGMVNNMLESYNVRHSAAPQFIIDRHKQWLELLYGWPLVGIGALWLTVFVLRLLSGHARGRDQAVLIFFIINAFYIKMFPQLSAVHLYRVFWFSSFLTLAVVDLVSDLYRMVMALLKRAPQRGPRVALVAVVAVLLAYFAVEAPKAYAALLESRVTMGTLGHPGYNADYSKQLFAMEVERRTGPEDFVFVHDNLIRRVEFYYYVDRSNANIGSLAQLPPLLKKHPRAVVLMDGYPPPGEQRLLYDLLKKHPGYLFDRYLMIDLREERTDFREYSFQALKPSWRWSWFVSHKYPPMATTETVSSFTSCLYAWARTKPAGKRLEPPEPPWNKGELVLCHHNYQVARGRTDVASAYLAKLRAHQRSIDVALPGYGRLVAHGAPTRRGIETWLVLDRSLPAELSFRWNLEPVFPAGGAPSSGDSRVSNEPPNPAPMEMAAGYLFHQPFGWSVRQGTYRLRVELVRPPDRRPPVGRGWHPPLIWTPPPPPPTAVPVASAEVATLDIK